MPLIENVLSAVPLKRVFFCSSVISKRGLFPGKPSDSMASRINFANQVLDSNCEARGMTAPSRKLSEGEITESASRTILVPRPVHSGQAPSGALKEK